MIDLPDRVLTALQGLGVHAGFGAAVVLIVLIAVWSQKNG